jgi:hypothetical protein
MQRLVLGITTLALATSCGMTPSQAPSKKLGSTDDGPPQGGISQFYTRNVVYRVDEDIVVGMPNLNADIQVKRPNEPFIPANMNDYVIHIHTGDISLDDASMTALFNKYVFNGPNSPLTDLKIANNGNGKISMTGTLHKGIPIPFSLTGALSPDGKGRLVLKPETVKSAGIPVKGLMDAIGLDMARLISSQSPGLAIDGDNIVLQPCKLLPPPSVDGFAVGATVRAGQVTMSFDDQVRRPYPELPEPDARNFLFMYGGNILINNHLITDAKLQEIDMTPEDPMYFYMPTYREQLAAGFVVGDHGNTIAYLPDVHGTTVPQGRYRPKL